MEQKNFAQSLGAFLKRRPFRSFVIEFVDGERLTIEHPEAVRYRGEGTAVHFGKKGEIALFDHEGVVKVSQRAKEAAAT